MSENEQGAWQPTKVIIAYGYKTSLFVTTIFTRCASVTERRVNLFFSAYK